MSCSCQVAHLWVEKVGEFMDVFFSQEERTAVDGFLIRTFSTSLRHGKEIHQTKKGNNRYVLEIEKTHNFQSFIK